MTTNIQQAYTNADLNLLPSSVNDEDCIYDCNIQEDQLANILVRDENTNKRLSASFGFLPQLYQRNSKTKYDTYNSCYEKLESSALWSSAYKKSQCLIPVSGIYCWVDRYAKKKSQNTPYIFNRPDAGVFYLGGLYKYIPETDSYTFSIVTCPFQASKNTPKRIPLILDGGDCQEWLNNSSNEDMFLNQPAYRLRKKEVSRRIDNKNLKELDLIMHVG